MFNEETMNDLAKELDGITWFDLELRTDVTDEKRLKEKLEILKEQGIAKPFDTVKPIIDEMCYDGSKLYVELRPGYFPTLSDYGPTGPLLSVFTHLISGSDPTSIEWYVFQVRGARMKAPGMIQPAAAGFVEFGEEPYESALRELNEETLGRYEIESSRCFLLEPDENDQMVKTSKPRKTLDFVPFTLKWCDTLNPLLSFVGYVPETELSNMEEATTIEDLRSYDSDPSSEVAKCVKVRVGRLPELLDRIGQEIGFYGPCRETIYNLLKSS